MGSKIEYVESSQLYTTSYVRNSKAIGVLWGVFTICFAIINVVVFVQPQWVGDTRGSNSAGYYGLWKFCFVGWDGPDLVCKGRLDDFGTVLNSAFRAATIFVGISALVILLCICCMLLFLFLSPPTVLRLCGWMQVFSAVCMLVGLLVFPAGWDAPEVRWTCGPAAGRFALGLCGVRWAYILAIIGFFDVVVLASLAFVLASRHVKLQPEPITFPANGSLYKGEINSAFVSDTHSLSGSRKSLNLQPVLLMPQPEADRFSEFSHRTGRSKSSAYRAEYASSVQNFQL